MIEEQPTSGTRDTGEIASRVSEFLQAVYLLDGQRKYRRSVNVIIDRVDDLLLESDVSLSAITECDEIFALADTNLLSESSIVSFLGITLRAKSLLTNRRAFYGRAINRIASLSDKGSALRLLTKYE